MQYFHFAFPGALQNDNEQVQCSGSKGEKQAATDTSFTHHSTARLPSLSKFSVAWHIFLSSENSYSCPQEARCCHSSGSPSPLSTCCPCPTLAQAEHHLHFLCCKTPGCTHHHPEASSTVCCQVGGGHTFFLGPETSLAGSVMPVCNAGNANTYIPGAAAVCHVSATVGDSPWQILQSDSKAYKSMGFGKIL